MHEPRGNFLDVESHGAGPTGSRKVASLFAAIAERVVMWMPSGFSRRKVYEAKARPGKAPVYVMKANHEKLVHVALVLLLEAARINMDATQVVLSKAVFFADRSHLNKHGRPITWDWYVAMPRGPVPMTFYNMLMGDPKIIAKTGEPQWSFDVLGSGMRLFHTPRMQPDLRRILSPSDVTELHAALAMIKEIGVDAAIALAHHDRAWLDAFDGPDVERFKAMSLELLLDEKRNADNSEEAAMLSRYSQLYN